MPDTVPDCTRDRLDRAMVARGLAETRARAAQLIREGHVAVDGRTRTKPAALVAATADLTLADAAWEYVSRSARKLKAGLEHFGFAVQGKVALDIGASTGGFTEVLLEAGARRVYAVDVGTAQLHPRLRADERVTVLENQDARALQPSMFTEEIDAVVADVSFISLTKVLATALAPAGPSAWLIGLVKPQFEAGRDAVGSGGIVRDEAAREAAVARVRTWVDARPGWQVVDVIASPVTGRGGNVEHLLGARRAP